MQSHSVRKRKEKHLFGLKEMIEFDSTFWILDGGRAIRSDVSKYVIYLLRIFLYLDVHSRPSSLPSNFNRINKVPVPTAA